VAGGGGSYEICPSCGFQFGVSDDDDGFTYASWREQWKKRTMPWSSRGIAPPGGWNPEAQLATLRTRKPKMLNKKKPSTRRHHDRN
jgi:hypothetical protein